MPRSSAQAPEKDHFRLVEDGRIVSIPAALAAATSRMSYATKAVSSAWIENALARWIASKVRNSGSPTSAGRIQIDHRSSRSNAQMTPKVDAGTVTVTVDSTDTTRHPSAKLD